MENQKKDSLIELNDQRIELFQIEELEQRFEMEPWLDMDVVLNLGCEVYFPGIDHGTVHPYYQQF